MANLFTPTTEFVDVVDGLETVTSIAVKTSSGSTTLSNVAGCKRTKLTKRDMEFFGQAGIESQMVVWHVPNQNLSDNALRPGDTITATAETWTILNTEKATRGTRWRCVCVKQR